MTRNESIAKAFNSFNGTNFEVLRLFYSENIEFIDPISHIHGLSQLEKHYEKLYLNVKKISFNFTDIYHDRDNCIACWTMEISVKGLNRGRLFQVDGTSVFKFNSEDRVYYHRDYFDLGQMLYEKLPLQGVIIKVIKHLLK
ncbi:MAG: nuclear transport factor 2 family protein [Bdellovibrionaceae bacterium]|nr:nuclear transport factor 2 family protein [Pseudobdellovibrionaceae bacterium]NUM60378.1 nuclear transport factor 2 family protein [Pseudobdellovibrionaceae bacterium]